MRIGICEDEPLQLRFLEHEIEAYGAQANVCAPDSKGCYEGLNQAFMRWYAR